MPAWLGNFKKLEAEGSWPVFWPSNNIIQNKNILANSNLELVFLKIYKDGVYCCQTLLAERQQNKKMERREKSKTVI